MAMKIVLATGNPHKIEEMLDYFKGQHLEFLSLKDFPPCELKEEGETLCENALQKARMMAQISDTWALADDTGLFVDALHGAPGIYSARYAGQKATCGENVAKLLRELKGVVADQRHARFESVLALVHPDGREVTVHGSIVGTILERERGSSGFGYDPIFFVPEMGLSFAEMKLEEKNRMSHRGKALLKMKGVLQELGKLENMVFYFQPVLFLLITISISNIY